VLKKNSFLDYISSKHNDLFCKRVTSFLYAHKDLVLDKLPLSVSRLGEIELSDIYYNTVYLDMKDADVVCFDIAIEAEIGAETISGKHNDHDYDSCRLWLMLRCDGKLSNCFSFINVNVDEFNKQRQQKPMTGDLVPIIRKDEYEKYAREILEKYYPEALSGVCKIDAEKLAHKMGLNIIYETISDNGSIFGQVFFEDSFINGDKNRPVKKDTIVIDSLSNNIFSYDSLNITIAHECVHFALHKKTYQFAKIIDKGFTSISCEAKVGVRGVDDTSNIKFMEIQANAIAPLLLMPEKSFNKAVETEIKALSSSSDDITYIPNMVEILAEKFGVSNYAIKKRLLDIGFYKAAGVLNWVDGHYLRTYTFKKGFLASNETFSISLKDFSNLVNKSPLFLINFNSNDLAFVENHVCINDSKYIEYPDSDPKLTDYALHHMDECCLKFKVEILNNTAFKLSTFVYLCRNKDINLSYDLSWSRCDGDALSDPDNLKINSINQGHINTILKEINMKSIGESLCFLLKYLDVPVKELASDTKITETSIYRYIKDTYKPEKEKLVAICVALKLHPKISFVLLNQCGYSLTQGDKKDDILYLVLTTLRIWSVSKVNQYLQNQIGCTLT
jgi:Zn-dependent peptidase ImmA (M78 family)/DNA-binding phage protein